MIFYVAFNENGHRELVGTQADARAINKHFEQIDIPTDKGGLQSYVQTLMRHLDVADETIKRLARSRPAPNPEREQEVPAELITPLPAPVQVQPPTPSYAEVSISIENAWRDLPMSMKLHFAADAMEEARSILYPPTPKPRWGEQ